jgi:hypothetical protein
VVDGPTLRAVDHQSTFLEAGRGPGDVRLRRSPLGHEVADLALAGCCDDQDDCDERCADDDDSDGYVGGKPNAMPRL